jgi:hypothetical protein
LLLNSAAIASSVSPNRLNTTASSIEATTPTTPPNTLLEWSKTRAEVSGVFTLKTIEPIAVTATNATRYYDCLGEVALECTVAPNRTVIGKVKDLDNLAPGENTLLKHLPDQGTPRANWRQNSSVLRQEIRKGNPIRDASLNPDGTLKNYPGSFLEAERNLLRNQGWTFDPSTGLWSPAK